MRSGRGYEEDAEATSSRRAAVWFTIRDGRRVRTIGAVEASATCDANHTASWLRQIDGLRQAAQSRLKPTFSLSRPLWECEPLPS